MIHPDIETLIHQEATRECFAAAEKLGRMFGRQMAIRSMLADYSAQQVVNLRNLTISDIRRHFEQGGADADDIDKIVDRIDSAAITEAFIISCALWSTTGGEA